MNIDVPPLALDPSSIVEIAEIKSGDVDKEGIPPSRETIEQPGKVMRIGSMIKQLLEEVRQANLDEASRVRLSEIYSISIEELAATLSPDLAEELRRMSPPFEDGVPSESELRVAQAQLVG
ncbi:MAG: DUF2587 domain-containing protein, partial [Acidimicrobiales bacterium]|nr:DUF2587 domain-containing protein [Acidimicrobiales bacterium]